MNVHNCQNCKKEFSIDPEDLEFYERIQVSPPTCCAHCRLVRRLSWQGYRILYKRKCDFTSDLCISTHSTSSPHKVYKQEVWWSDKWDPKEYGREYDFSKSFFEQFGNLLLDTPLPSLHTEYSRLVQSEYCNAATDLKNCYLVFRTTGAEDSAYLNMIVDAKESFDVGYSNFVEACYESVELQRCFQVFYSENCEECHHVWFSRDLVGCSYCIGCTNLRHKSYCIFNKQYEKNQYEEEVKKFNVGSYACREKFKKEIEEWKQKEPSRSMLGTKNVNVSGDCIFSSKNVHDSYMVRNAENVRYSQFLKNGPTANCYDYSIFSDGAEWVYESCWVGLNTNNVKFSFWSYRNHNIEYCFGCMGCANLFGCVGLRKAEYCILNKQYEKSEYHEIVKRIKDQMKSIPYINSLNHTYFYGEFFPHELCPWKYNESTAYEWWPLEKEAALREGMGWRDETEGSGVQKEEMRIIPDHIKDVDSSILKSVLMCESCHKKYLLVSKEIEFYKKYDIPIPCSCALCRDRGRIKRLRRLESSDRTCAKCGQVIKTNLSLEQAKIVYCGDCYNAEYT